jgi:hypothetical protein
LRNGETLQDPPIDKSRLHLLWDFNVASEARTRADNLRAEDLSDEERHLIEWFIDAHQNINTSTTDS